VTSALVLSLFVSLLAWLVHRNSIALANSYTKLVFRLLTLWLPEEARSAWRVEVLDTDLLPRIFDDLKAGKSKLDILIDAGFRATNLLLAGWPDRRFYQDNPQARRPGRVVDLRARIAATASMPIESVQVIRPSSIPSAEAVGMPIVSIDDAGNRGKLFCPCPPSDEAAGGEMGPLDGR